MPSPEEIVVQRCEQIAERYGEACVIFDSEFDKLCELAGADPTSDTLISALVDKGWDHQILASRGGTDAPGIVKKGGDNE